MENHLLEYIEIKNFKCFDDFKAEGFKRVNLIGGKNNVGKTAFMEACYINVYAQDAITFLKVLVYIKFLRESINTSEYHQNPSSLKFFKQRTANYMIKLNNVFIKTNNNTILHTVENEQNTEIYKFNDEVITKNQLATQEDLVIPNIRLIDNLSLANNKIIYNYSAVQKQDAEPLIHALLKEFDSRIQAFKIIDGQPQCKINDDYLELSECGYGVRHLVSIVTSLYQTQNGYLFIDEIDNGIHYTMLDKLWETILTLAKQQNVQVFATTHSKECIESYYRAAKKLEEQDIAYILMTRLKNGRIHTSIYDYELLDNSMEQDYEIRGRK